MTNEHDLETSVRGLEPSGFGHILGDVDADVRRSRDQPQSHFGRS